MELIIDVSAYYKEQFLEYANTNSAIDLRYGSTSGSDGLNISIPELITVVSTTVTAVELARLLVGWLKGVKDETVVVRTKNIEANIKINKDLSEEEVIKLITKLANLNDEP